VVDRAIDTAGALGEAWRVVHAWRCPPQRQASAITPLRNQTGYGEAIPRIEVDHPVLG
jgi:hypothetical protein